MKKIHYLLLMVLLASASVKAQTGWITKKIDDKISVKFPVEPKMANKNGMNIYGAKGADSAGYIANVVDFKTVANLDSAALAPIKDTEMFADQIKTGMSSSMPNYVLSDITIGKWKGYTTYSLTGTGTTKKDKMLIYLILIGSKMCTLSCILPADVVSKNSEAFFNSLQLSQ